MPEDPKNIEYADYVAETRTNLRGEILANQEAHIQFIKFKLISITIIVSFFTYTQQFHYGTINSVFLLLVPPLIAICFDLILNGYRNATRRIGKYTKDHLERGISNQPEGFVPWEQYVLDNRFGVGIYGNFGITLVAAIPAIYYFIQNNSSLLIILIILLVVDACVFRYANYGEVFYF